MPECIVQMAVEESTGRHRRELPEWRADLLCGQIQEEERRLSHLKLIMGGVMPPGDAEKLTSPGVAAAYTPGTRTTF